MKAETIFSTITYKEQTDNTYYQTTDEARAAAIIFSKSIKDELLKHNDIKSVNIYIKQVDFGAAAKSTIRKYIPFTQFRVYTTIEKQGKKITKNDIAQIINSYKISYYEGENDKQIQEAINSLIK